MEHLHTETIHLSNIVTAALHCAKGALPVHSWNHEVLLFETAKDFERTCGLSNAAYEPFVPEDRPGASLACAIIGTMNFPRLIEAAYLSIEAYKHEPQRLVALGRVLRDQGSSDDAATFLQRCIACKDKAMDLAIEIRGDANMRRTDPNLLARLYAHYDTRLDA